eukprot:TRINITY_DN1861_c0_g1_i1.p1 TRINITY_DN1861_c0_g1~~TRINITY_DN1861_c0_g1_i1.p1  ORF type:complete len:855 (-),score=205.54 TRINITY_DN1861_c0_g1_i1:10-2541(-)
MQNNIDELIDIQKQVQKDINELELKNNEDYYLLSIDWYDKFKNYIDGKSDYCPGKIDNSSLIESNTGKIIGQETINYYFLSKNSWNILFNHFDCEVDQIICRKCVSFRRHPVVEINPLKMKLKYEPVKNFDEEGIRSSTNAHTHSDLKSEEEWKEFVSSKYAEVDSFITKVMDVFNIDNEKRDTLKVRIKFPSGLTKILNGDLKAKQLLNLGSFGNPLESEVIISKDFAEEKTSSVVGLNAGTLGSYDVDTNSNKSNKSLESSSSSSYTYYRSNTSSNYGCSSNYGSNYGNSRNNYLYHSGTRKSSEKGVSGLRNLGNTCYMNAALQCLSNTQLLRNYFLKNEYEQDLTPQNILGSKNCCVAKAMATFYKEIWENEEAVVVPSYVKQSVSRNDHFIGFRQEDSHELLAYILDMLNEDLTRVYPKPATTETKQDGLTDLEISDLELKRSRMRDDSIVQDIFEFQQLQIFECPQCKNISKTFPMFRFLTTPIPPESIQREIYFVPLDSSKPVIKHKFVLHEDMLCGEVYSYVQKRIGFKNGVLVKKSRHSSVPFVTESDDKFSRWEDLLIYELSANIDNSKIYFVVNSIKETKKSSYYMSSSLYTTTKVVGRPFIIMKKKGQDDLDAINEAGIFKKPIDMDVVSFDHRYSRNGGNIIRIIWKSDNKEEIAEYFDLNEQDVDLYEAVDGFKEKSGGVVTLDECLLLNNERSQLDEENAWFCPKCREHVQAFVSTEFFTLPKVLIIHLKRFTKHFSKNSTFIDFPIEELDMEPYVSERAQNLNMNYKYELYGVIQHHGSTAGGHYVAAAKNSINNKWYDFNDSSTSFASKNDIVSDSAYVLFYELKK